MLQEVRAGLVNESICVSVFSQIVSPNVFEIWVVVQFEAGSSESSPGVPTRQPAWGGSV